MHRHRRAALLLFSAALSAGLACNEGFDAAMDAGVGPVPDAISAMPGAAAGTVKGLDLMIADAVAIDFRASGAGLDGVSTVIALHDLAGVCAREAASVGTPNRRFLVIFLGITDAQAKASPAVQPETFTIMQKSAAGFPPNSAVAQLFFQETDSACFGRVIGQAIGGTVQLTLVDPNTRSVEGTFAAQFADGEALEGNFAALRCPALNPNRTPLSGC